MPVDLVEAVVEKHYATVALTDLERDEIRKALAEDLGERVSTARHEIERCQGVLDEIKEQERKLLNMHYEDRISSELFDDEQARLRQRRQNAETLIERLGVGYQDVAETLDLALEIISEDLQGLYLRADDTIRRLINQAIFKALYLSDEEITRAELAEPFIQLHRLQNNMRSVVDAATAEKPLGGGRTAKGSRPNRGQEPLDVGSISDVMVDLRREFSNSCTSAKSLVRRLLRRVGKGGKVAQESPVTVFEDARGPNVRVLRQAQRRLSPAELEALIADYEAGGRVGELAKVYRLHRATVAGHVARAGKTRPVMTEAQIKEAVLLYRDGWTLHNVGQRLGVADQTIRRVLVERAVTIRPGGRRKIAALA